MYNISVAGYDLFSQSERSAMRIAMTKPLFAWDELEDSLEVSTIRRTLSLVPDGKLLASLRAWRGRGRNDYPVEGLWGTVLLTIALRHVTFEACLAELRRNEALRRLIGIEREQDVAKKWNVSRFLKALGEEPHLTLLKEMFDAMARRLGDVVPDLGKRCAGDSTGLSAKAVTSEVLGNRTEGEEGQRRDLPAPAGGRKEYTDETGKATRVVEWEGYKLHLLVDAAHEVALAYAVTSVKTADAEALPGLVDGALGVLGAGRIESLAYDKAADSGAAHRMLHARKIAPVIENRSVWKEEFERALKDNVVYDEAGTVYCYDVLSKPPVRRKMAYIGHEPSRGTLKYRCPARHEGWRCKSDARCNGKACYGKTVRVRRQIDLRRFPPIPRATKTFERLYRGRTAVERVNARLKVFWGVDDGNIAGGERFFAFVGSVMVVHLALATLLAGAPRREGTLGRMKFSPIAEALRRKLG